MKLRKKQLSIKPPRPYEASAIKAGQKPALDAAEKRFIEAYAETAGLSGESLQQLTANMPGFVRDILRSSIEDAAISRGSETQRILAQAYVQAGVADGLQTAQALVLRFTQNCEPFITAGRKQYNQMTGQFRK